jgi:hypothetical protein
VKNKAFLETTACVDLLFDYKGESLTGILKDYPSRVTSWYSLMEIKKGVLQYLVYFYGILHELNSWSSVQKTLNGLHSSFHKKRLLAILREIEALYRQEFFHKPLGSAGLREDENLDRQLCREAKRYLHLKLRKYEQGLKHIVDTITNEMNCFKDMDPPRYEHEKWFNDKKTCTKSRYSCDIYNFFIRHDDDLDKIITALKAIETPDKETTERIKALKELRKKTELGRSFDNNQEVDAKLCYSCSDAILALTAPRDSVIITSNQKHFEPICNALTKIFAIYHPREIPAQDSAAS